MKNLKIVKYLILTGITILCLLAFGVFPSDPLNAQQAQLNIQILPGSTDLKINDEKIIKIILSGDSEISGFDLKFETSGSLTITDFRNQLTFDNNLNPFEARKVIEDTGSNPRLSYIFTTSSQNLPKSITIFAKIKGTSTGTGKITLDYNSSQVLDSGGKPLQVKPITAVFNLNTNQSSGDFIDPKTLPQTDYPDTTAVVNLKIKLYGARSQPGKKIKATAVAVGRIGEGKYETLPYEFELTADGKGAFLGIAAFPDFKDGNKFSLMIGADKYLLRRICNPELSEESPGSYTCREPGLTIRQGNTSFDFSAIQLLPGDLGQTDGYLNGYDLSIVRNNLGKKDTEALNLADLNYDGLVDEKDFNIIGFIAGNTGRKADQ